MLERSNLVIRGRGEQTKRRQQTDILLKKAMKGNRQAKLKLYKEFGIKLYSSEEVEKYVQERVAHEYPLGEKRTSRPRIRGSNGPIRVTEKAESKCLSNLKTPKSGSHDQNSGNGRDQGGDKSLSSRRKFRDKTRKLAKKI
ncbi:MAG: hypothetical protein ACE5K2_04960 [Candidatus Zixiibacteriota bacterium]